MTGGRSLGQVLGARLGPAPVALHAFARSRSKPVRRAVPPLSWLRLAFDERVGWRLALRPDPHGDLLAALPAVWAELRALSDAELDRLLARRRVRAQDLMGTRGALALAEGLEVIRRHMGFDLRANQMACALSLLSGECVELRTGEGKTLAAGLAALVAARAGISTHVVTVNDYLAQRDHALILPMARRMGLRATVLTQDMEDAARNDAYDADIVYGTNKSFVFDHLRDLREARTRPGAVPRQMGQAFAICDEADSVLIDDATVPMILSEVTSDLPEGDVALFRALDHFAAAAQPGRDRLLDPNGVWRLTPVGLAALERAAKGWPHPVARSEDIVALAESALAARYQFRPGEAYVVDDGAVKMIDQATGRLMPDRRWEYGLQQLVEIAAGLPPTAESRTVARITQQTYFRQYRVLSGLTGTARECRPEFWAIYRLAVRPIAAHAPMRLIDHGLAVLPDAAAKWAHICRRALAMAQGRAVLIGLNDVTEAEALARHFADIGREVAVLDALAEADEAALVARAGGVGRITIATHLAGRGTDIKLDPVVRANGGLHVIIGSVMASARLERQLYGRAGRAGDPGSYERAIALTDRGLRDGAMGLWRRLLTRALRAGPLVPGLAAWALGGVQANRDARALVARRSTLLREQDLTRQLGYR